MSEILAKKTHAVMASPSKSALADSALTCEDTRSQQSATGKRVAPDWEEGVT